MPNDGEMPQSALADLIATILEQQSPKVDLVCYPTIHASLIVLIAAVFLARRRGTATGPSLGRMFNRATLTFGVFFSVMLFNCSLSTHSDLSLSSMFLAHLFDTLQMMLANREVVSIARESAGEYYGILVFYELLVYLAAPITTFIDVLPLFEGTTSRLRVLRHSLFRDTYLITPLNEQTLALAKSISKKHDGSLASYKEGLSEKVNIVFTDCGEDDKASLKNRAYDTGAVCVGRSIEEMLSGIWKRCNIRVVFDGSDVTNLSRAMKIYENEKDRVRKRNERGRARKRKEKSCARRRKKPDTRIYLYTPLASAGEMLPEQPESGDVRISRVDWTRNLVESTLCRYPLFMLNPSPDLAARFAKAKKAEEAKKAARAATTATKAKAAKPEKESPDVEGRTLTGVDAITHQERMLEADKRRVVIVGAGHVGTEFLKMALTYSCSTGLSFTFDVIDNVPDPENDRCCSARSVMRASAPELFDLTGDADSAVGRTVRFHCFDVNGVDYEDFMCSNAPTITYVFIAMGVDTLTADTAMRTRKILERGILKDCMKEGLEEDCKRAYAERCRPVVVAVIDDDGLGKQLADATSENLSQYINVVGSRESMFTFESMRLKDWRETDYKQRSTHLAKETAKYKMFAFAKRARGGKFDISNRAIDWSADFRSVLELKVQGDTLKAIKTYNIYCRYAPMIHNNGNGEKKGHEWLLRMEHLRWSTYIRTEGFRTATIDEAKVYASVFHDGDDAHRSDETGLHPCLVGFDELPKVDELWKEIYGQDALEVWKKVNGDGWEYISFKEKNNSFIQVEPRTQKSPEKPTEDED